MTPYKSTAILFSANIVSFACYRRIAITDIGSWRNYCIKFERAAVPWPIANNATRRWADIMDDTREKVLDNATDAFY